MSCLHLLQARVAFRCVPGHPQTRTLRFRTLIMAAASAPSAVSLQHYKDSMTLSSAQLKQLAEVFAADMEAGLQQQESTLLMIPSHVDVIPDGQEKGEYFGIEFGGSKLRVMYTKLSDTIHELDSMQIEEGLIPEAYKQCGADELFDYIVCKLLVFAESIGRPIEDAERPVVGFCFSFPVDQKSINSGTLIKWTKGFENEGGVGRDPCIMLTEAFRRQSVTAEVAALVNDTVGTLAAARYSAGCDAQMAIIMGTGTNACYLEHIGNISKWMEISGYFPRTSDMVVNIEWPGFHTHLLPRMEEDAQLDAESYNAGDQLFEKLTSGLYMGDIGRRILLRLAESNRWFPNTSGLRKASRFTTVQLAAIAHDESQDLGTTGRVLAEVVGVSEQEVQHDIRRQAKEICLLVACRSAYMTAAAISGILLHQARAGVTSPRDGSQQSGGPRNIVAIDGGIFAKFGVYSSLVLEGVRQTLGAQLADQLELKMTPGGAGLGAACLAAAAHNYAVTMGHDSAPAPARRFPPRRTGSTTTLSALG